MGADADGDEWAPCGRDSLVRVVHLRPAVPVVHVQGCLDHTTAPAVQKFVLEVLATSPWAVVLDLRALTDLAPDAVPALVELACVAGDADTGLYLVTTDPVVAHVLAAAGVHRLFEIHPDIDSALRTMGRPQ
jgi:anti-sigma B factor antagonist